jgi:hypothetical protein
MKYRIFSFLLLLSASFAKAQDVKLASGKIEGLKGVDTFHIVFDYTKLSVGECRTGGKLHQAEKGRGREKSARQCICLGREMDE